MPLLDKLQKGDSKAVKNQPRPRRSFQFEDLVYKDRVEDLRKKGKQLQSIDILTSVVEMLHKLIPVAEENYHEYPFHTNAAAVNHLTNQLRETLNDINSLEDFSKRSDLISDFVASEFRNLLQAAVSDMFIAQKTIQADPKTTNASLDRVRESIARRFGESEKNVRKRVAQLLTVKT